MRVHGSEIKLTTDILIFIVGIFEYWNKHWVENLNILRDLRPSGPIKLYQTPQQYIIIGIRTYKKNKLYHRINYMWHGRDIVKDRYSILNLYTDGAFIWRS